MPINVLKCKSQARNGAKVGSCCNARELPSKTTGSNLSRCICSRPSGCACLCSLHRRETSNNTQNYAVATHKSSRNYEYYSQIRQPLDTAGHSGVPILT